jgi:hypothetical protein
MNWKTVRQLIGVEMKSGRLMRGQRLIKYNVVRNRIYSYLGYVAAIIIGVVAGALTMLVYNSLLGEPNFTSLFRTGFANFQYSLPTLILLFAFIFSMMQQIQRSGVSFSRQPPYWLPVTWQEHTLAAILADVLGMPILAVLLISPAVLIVGVSTGVIAQTIGTVLAMFAAALMASSTTEILRIIQNRFTGAVYKSTGRAAVWVRFISSLMFFILFYVIYFSITSGANAINFIQAVASAQSAIWFVPFVWLGLTLYSFSTGAALLGAAFLAASLLFIFALFYVGIWLNGKLGLYEPPAITVSRGVGVYTPKTGILGKLGFSSVEAALIRKDLKAFTRRRELMSAFIIPIVFILIPLMTSINGGAESGFPPQFGFAFTTVFPLFLMASSLGSFMTGEEGQNIWRIYSSPISAGSFVKSKYAFMLLFSFIILPIVAAIGFVIYHPSINTVVALVLEAVFVAFAASALSLGNGIKGADFTEVPRPRMIRAEWSLISMVTSFVVALVIVAPLFPYVITMFSGEAFGPFMELWQAVLISGAIGTALTVIFYKIAVGNAKELLTRAEV